MPFRLRKAPKRDLYWVVDDEGKKYSKDPMPKEKARQQQKALYAAEGRGELKGGITPEQNETAMEEVAKELNVNNPPELDHFERTDIDLLANEFGLNDTIIRKLIKEVVKRKHRREETNASDIRELLLSGRTGFQPRRRGRGMVATEDAFAYFGE